MAKRAIFAIAGFVGVCLFLSAEQTQGADQLQFDGSTLDPLALRLPSITLEDSQRFFFSTSFGWTQPTANFLPTFNPVAPRSVASPKVSGRRDTSDYDVDDMRVSDRIRVGGEIGFLYGRSSGKYGGTFESGYVIGELGNDWFHLTVGTSYERWSGRGPRWGR